MSLVFLRTCFSQIAVFSVDRSRLQNIRHALKANKPIENYRNSPSLTLIQSISTLPAAFPSSLNTCGRVCVHPSGRFVVVSNRGHESITVYRVRQNGCNRGKLNQIGFFHTRGETPRHFQFDASGQYLVVANQDSDCISVFSFNLSTGQMKFTGNTYRVPSPNFVCCCSIPHDEDFMCSDVQGLGISQIDLQPYVFGSKKVVSALTIDSETSQTLETSDDE